MIETEKTEKQIVIDIISSMPENSSMDEILYNIYVQNKISTGYNDIKQNKSFSTLEIEQEMQKWLK